MASSSATLTSAMLAPGLKKVFNEVTKEHKTEYTAFMNVMTSRRQFEEMAQFVGFGSTPNKPEGLNTIYDDPVARTTVKRFTHVSRGLGFRVTREAQDDDLYSQFKKLTGRNKAMGLARSNLDVVEQQAANELSLGFSTATDIAGVSVYNAAHARLDGGTAYDNSDTSSLSITALQTMTNYYETATNERSLISAMRPGLLVIPPNLRFTAREIFGSSSKPFTSDNEINSMLDEDLKWTVNHFLSTTTEWHAFGTDKEQHWPIMFWRTPFTFENGSDFDSGDSKFKTFGRTSTGQVIAQGRWGATG